MNIIEMSKEEDIMNLEIIENELKKNIRKEDLKNNNYYFNKENPMTKAHIDNKLYVNSMVPFN
jgi:hypothetical protein